MTDVEVLWPDDPEHYLNRPERPLTEAEKAFRLHVRADNPHARGVSQAYARWAALTRERWIAQHPPAEPKAATPKRKAPKAAPKYNMKWDPGIAPQGEPATLLVKEEEP